LPRSAAGGRPAKEREGGTAVGVVYLRAHEKAPSKLRRKIKRKDKSNISIRDMECERGRNRARARHALVHL
jgi:hypothetical protein